MELTYYDTGSNSYKTVKSEPVELTVTPGSGKPSSVTDYSQQKASDILPIKDGKASLKPQGSYFFGSQTYWFSLLLPLLTFIVLLVVFRRRAIENADLVKQRGRKANKVATKRLRKARQLMERREQNAFYDEVLRALWGYVGDKLNMPVEQLSRENISGRLADRNVNEETISRFIGALDECEFERYAPGDAAGNMSKTFEQAMTAIESIESC